LIRQEIIDFVARQDMDSEDAQEKLSSLRAGTLLPGDIVFVPACAIVIEKSVKENNIGLRSTSTFMRSRSQRLFSLYRQVHPAKLGLAMFKTVLSYLEELESIFGTSANFIQF